MTDENHSRPAGNKELAEKDRNMGGNLLPPTIYPHLIQYSTTIYKWLNLCVYVVAIDPGHSFSTDTCHNRVYTEA